MSISFTDDTLAIWYCLLSPEVADYMGGLSRRPDGYTYTWRMRYYNSLDPWDENDEKTWYSILIPSREGDAEEVVDKIRELIAISLATSRKFAYPNPGPVYELVRGNKSFDEFTKEFMNAPFVHKKVVQ